MLGFDVEVYGHAQTHKINVVSLCIHDSYMCI